LKIAIVGAGISGLSCAYYLAQDHDVTVFESASEIGGHTATKWVELNGESHQIDTGFIVYNDWTYPNFIKLMNELDVSGRESEMSFSVTCESTGLEYAGSNLNTLFADRTNLLRPSYWKMLRDIVRFNRQAIEDLDNGVLKPEITLGEYLDGKNYGSKFREKYLLPMGAAIWSSTVEGINDFQALFFVRFFKNHGLLSVKNRPQWYTLKGGSKSYLPVLTASYKDSIHTNTEIRKISRAANHIDIDYCIAGGELSSKRFDALVIAAHSDQALAMLDDASDAEKSILSAVDYRMNEVVLHTDSSRLPERRAAWSSWNYRISANTESAVDDTLAKLTYNMNILQGIESDTVFCVSLNQTDEIDADKILGTYHYSHPVFTEAAVIAQKRWNEIAGSNNTWFCGAYWANGFHEDGVVSALRVADSIKRLANTEYAVDSAATETEAIVS